MKKFTEFKNQETALNEVLKAVSCANYAFDGYELSSASVRQEGGRLRKKPEIDAKTLVFVGGDMEEAERELVKVLKKHDSVSMNPTSLEVCGYSETYNSSVLAKFHKCMTLTGRETYLVEFAEA